MRGRVPSLVAALTRDGVLEWRGSYGEVTGAGDTAARRPAVPHRLDHQDDDRRPRAPARDRGAAQPGRPGRQAPPRHGVRRPHAARAARARRRPARPSPRGTGGSGSTGRRSTRWPRPSARGRPRSRRGRPSTTATSATACSVRWSRGSVAAPGGRCLCGHLLEPLGMLRTTYDPFEPHAQGWSVDPGHRRGRARAAHRHRRDGRRRAGVEHGHGPGHLRRPPRARAPRRAAGRGARPDVHPAVRHRGRWARRRRTAWGCGCSPAGPGTLVGHTGSMPGFQAALMVDRPRRAGGGRAGQQHDRSAPARAGATAARPAGGRGAVACPSRGCPAPTCRHWCATWSAPGTGATRRWTSPGRATRLVSRHRSGDVHGTWRVVDGTVVGVERLPPRRAGRGGPPGRRLGQPPRGVDVRADAHGVRPLGADPGRPAARSPRAPRSPTTC